MEAGLREKLLFEEVPVNRAIVRLALPSVFGQVILVIYNMADTFFVGLTRSDAMLTAVTVSMPAFMFLSAIANLFGVGGASTISRILGKNRPDQAGDACSFALWGCLALTLAYCGGTFLFLDQFVPLLGGTDPAVHAYAKSYVMLTVVLAGLPTAVSNLFSHLLRSEGRSGEAGAGVILGGVLNLCLDPLFMFVFLPPGQEVMGAAAATALSNVVSLCYFVLALTRRNRSSVLRFGLREGTFQREIRDSVLRSGAPACLMTLFENISYGVLDKLMSLEGLSCQAGLGVASKVNMLSHCMVRGLAQGVLPLIGYNYASGNRLRMEEAVNRAAAAAVLLAGGCMVGNLVFGKLLVGLFIRQTSDSLLYGTAFLRILCLGAPFSACAYIVISVFQAMGEGWRAFLLASLRKGIMDIPLMFVLGRALPVFGIVWATPVTDLFCSAAALTLYRSFSRRPAQKEKNPSLNEREGEASCGF